MRKILIVGLSLLFIGSLAFAETEAVVRGNTQFALDLYDNLSKAEGNLFLSPYSISTALAMTYAGARTNTEKQMAEVLHFTLSQEQLHPAFAGLEAQLNVVQARGNVELNVANALWSQKDYSFLKSFIDLTNQYYNAALYPVDFEKDTQAARLQINGWVEQKTKDKIKELIKPGVLDPLTRLVLTNAIYFKGKWASQFEKKNTKQDSFWLTSDKSVKVPMMYQSEEFGYKENESLQILELPYKGRELSMIILLPKKVDGLAQLEESLSTANLEAWLSNLIEEDVRVYLPKFNMTSEFSLAETLTSMGMSDAFLLPPADFSGMNGKRDLFISKVIHKAFVDVDEEGTEAAAATAVVMAGEIVTATPPVVFNADHPFLFLIRHNKSGSILFLGRIVNPGM